MKILISQKAPSKLTAYSNLEASFGASVDFKPFFVIETMPDKDFRTQRINLQEYSAVIFSSRHAIDAYFGLCETLRIKVPETMKYFCSTEVIAMYLQKHIVFRKRKIFFGEGTPESIVNLIGTKHRDEKFLVTASEGSDPSTLTSLLESRGLNFSVANLVRPVSQDLRDIDLSSYDFIVLYNPSDVKSLFENFPDYRQGNTKFVSFGKSIVKAMQDAGLEISVKGPTPEAPSVAKAIENYLAANK